MKDYHDKHLDASEDESPIYAGTGYLSTIIMQMNAISAASDIALREGRDSLLGWLIKIRIFYNSISLKLNILRSDKEIEHYEYISKGGNLIKQEIKIKEKEKYIKWFSEIESLIRKNQQIEENNVSTRLKDNNDSRIKIELGDCQVALYQDANESYIIMPRAKENMKDLAKSNWIDREFSKEF